MRPATWVPIVALVVVAAACGSDSGKGSRSGSSATPASPPSSSSSTTSPATSATGPCLPGATTGPFTSASTAPALLTNLAVRRADCTDTVTFSFKTGTGTPGYDVRYKSGPFHDAGSGTPHAVSGNAFLVVRLNPAWIADFSQSSAPLTYRGPKSIKPTGVAHVQDLELVEAFEAYVTWVVGLDSQRPLTVTTSASPPSLVITLG